MRLALAALALLLAAVPAWAEVRTVAVDAVTGQALATISATGAPQKVTGGRKVPIVTTPGVAFGTFKAVTRTTAGTTEIVAPDPGGSIIITWVAASGEKQAGSAVTIRFTDGTNNVDLMVIDQVDAPPNLAIAFSSRVQGWQDARVDLITSGAGDATVSIGYVKIPVSIPFAEWDALR